MATKIKTITLETFEQLDPERFKRGEGHTGQTRRVWRVVKVTDSTEFNPTDILLKPQVDELCSAKAWKVTIQDLAKKR